MPGLRRRRIFGVDLQQVKVNSRGDRGDRIIWVDIQLQILMGFHVLVLALGFRFHRLIPADRLPSRE